jgi:hypothetical protein
MTRPPMAHRPTTEHMASRTVAGRELFANGDFHAAGCLLNMPDGAWCDCDLLAFIERIEDEARNWPPELIDGRAVLARNALTGELVIADPMDTAR